MHDNTQNAITSTLVSAIFFSRSLSSPAPSFHYQPTDYSVKEGTNKHIAVSFIAVAAMPFYFNSWSCDPAGLNVTADVS